MTRRPTGRFLAAVSVATCLGIGGVARAQFIAHSTRDHLALEGNWQSCRESDGKYSERVYDGKWPGLPPFELHMGPFHDFALYRGIQSDHRDHDSPDNLLRPHTVEMDSGRASHSWDVAGLRLNVTLAGGSREDCESWYITLVRSTNSSSN